MVISEVGLSHSSPLCPAKIYGQVNLKNLSIDMSKYECDSEWDYE